jgi:hypothetical protein
VTTRRQRIIRILAGATALALLIPVIYVAYVHARVTATVERHQAEVDRLLHDVPVRNPTRPALLGPPEPGNVWDILRPALDSVADLYPLDTSLNYDETRDPDFDWRGAPDETRKLIEQAGPALEACRRAMRRSSLQWIGLADPGLPAKVGRIARALCTRAAYAWQAGRDAEAAEWLVVALGVAQDAARLGQDGTWHVLLAVEHWACLEARLGLSSHGFASPDLEAFGRRLDILRRQRPSLAHALRIWGAYCRQDIFDGDAQVELRPSGDRDSWHFVPVEKTARWKDLFSERICRARVLNGVRDGIEDLGGIDDGIAHLWTRAANIQSRYPAESVVQLLPNSRWFEEQEEAIVRITLLRLAVGVAEAQVRLGHFPRSLSEVGLPVNINRSLSLEEGRLDGRGGSDNLELVWTIGRRTKD